MLGDVLPDDPDERFELVTALAREMGLSLGLQYTKTLSKRGGRVSDIVDRLRAIKVWQDRMRSDG